MMLCAEQRVLMGKSYLPCGMQTIGLIVKSAKYKHFEAHAEYGETCAVEGSTGELGYLSDGDYNRHSTRPFSFSCY